MPPKLPDNVLKLHGTYRADRHAKRQPVRAPGEVGEPPDHLDEAATAAWGELAGAAPWLRAADRATLEVVAGLLAELRRDPGAMKTSRVATLGQMLARLGCDPAARSRIVAHGEVPEAVPESFMRRLAEKRGLKSKDRA